MPKTRLLLIALLVAALAGTGLFAAGKVRSRHIGNTFVQGHG